MNKNNNLEEGFYSPHTRRDQIISRHIIEHDLLLLPKKKKK